MTYRAGKRTANWVWLAAVLVAVALVWCAVYRRWTPADWKVPLRYRVADDDLAVFAVVNAHAERAIGVFGTKTVPRLNAPFGADWNDYPITEDLLFEVMGVAARGVGLFAAVNLTFFGASLLAAACFYASCRWLGYRREFAFAGAFAFALPTLLFQRGIGHISLAQYWYIPLVFAGLERLRDRRTDLRHRRRVWLFAGCGLGLLATWLSSPYYTWMCAQFIGFSLLALLVQKQRARAGIAAAWLASIAAAFVAGNADTVVYALQHGPNRGAVVRGIAELDSLALSLPSLVLPPPIHRLSALGAWTQAHFYRPTRLGLEGTTPYLGVLGIAGLLLLLGGAAVRVVQNRRRPVPVASMHAGWVLAYSLPGGVNLVLAVFGLVLFRCTSRYSIFLLALGLMFFVRWLSRHCPRRWAVPAALALAAIAALDQTPAALTSGSISILRSEIDSDRSFVQALEKRAGNGAMIFELPPVAFPESPPVHDMVDYEQSIPYLYSHTLRLSYGTVKGRGEEAWQEQVAAFAPARMVTELRKLGFAAIYLNRRAYPDNAHALWAGLAPFGPQLESHAGDLAAVIIGGGKASATVPIGVTLGAGFYGWEHSDGATWSWSTQRAELTLFSREPDPASVHLRLVLNLPGVRAQTVALRFGSDEHRFDLSKGGAPVDLPLTLHPGPNIVSFTASEPAEPPSPADRRPMAFGIFNLTLDRNGSQR